jgi:hypothetical protein
MFLLSLQIFITIQRVQDLLHQYNTDTTARDVVVLQITAVRTQAEAVKTPVTHLLQELNRKSQHTQLFSSRQHSTDSSAGTAHTRCIVAAVNDAISGHTAQSQCTAAAADRARAKACHTLRDTWRRQWRGTDSE